jgi:DNA-binding transcriptional ArsR family regulator
MGNSGARNKSEQPLAVRLAVVFTDQLRLKVVTELNRREMSANEFLEEFGGGSVSRVFRHFSRLEEYGWLEQVGTATGGRRRGAEERFYRATGPAVFDTRSWSEVPDSIRAIYSRHIFEQLAERITAAMEAGSFDARGDRHCSWTPVFLDRLGWKNLVAKTDALFECLFEEQESAMRRMSESGEEPIPATVALAVFESPHGTRDHEDETGRSAPADRQPAVPRGKGRSEVPMSLRLSKVFDSPLRLKIVTELNRREMSASQFFREFGGSSVSNVSGHFKKLREYGWLEQVGTATGGRRRGGVERFYRATGPAIFDNRSWSDVPDSIKATYSWHIFEQLAERITAAMEAGSFDARGDRHFTWTPVFLDEPGWKSLIAQADALFECVFEEQESAMQRMSESGEEPIPATVALAVFESPRDSSRAP